MSENFQFASIFGLLLSVPSIIQGIRVIIGIHKPDQIILVWLVYYNILLACISLFAVYQIWTAKKSRLPLLIPVMHFSVLIILIAIYFSTGMVAVKSILAMAMRAGVWAFIYFLLRKKT